MRIVNLQYGFSKQKVFFALKCSKIHGCVRIKRENTAIKRKTAKERELSGRGFIIEIFLTSHR